MKCWSDVSIRSVWAWEDREHQEHGLDMARGTNAINLPNSPRPRVVWQIDSHWFRPMWNNSCCAGLYPEWGIKHLDGFCSMRF